MLFYVQFKTDFVYFCFVFDLLRMSLFLVTKRIGELWIYLDKQMGYSEHKPNNYKEECKKKALLGVLGRL